MTWTQLTLHLPGGIRLELLSLYRPPTKCPTLPPPAVIETQGHELPDNVIAFPAARKCGEPQDILRRWRLRLPTLSQPRELATFVRAVDRELRAHTACGYSVPTDVAAWLAGLDSPTWRLLAWRAGLPEYAVTPELLNAVIEVYEQRGVKLRKVVRDAYADSAPGSPVKLKAVG